VPSASPNLQPDAFAARVAGFIAHLRTNDFPLGPAETRAALDLTHHVDLLDARDARLAFKTLLAGRQSDWERFDDLYEAYWHQAGKVRQRPQTSDRQAGASTRPKVWQDFLAEDKAGDAPGPIAGAGGDDDRNAMADEARIAASKRTAIATKDLRHIVDPAELAEAEQLASRLARAMRYRLSRRSRVSPKGPRFDLRRTVRRNLPHGGEPIELVRRKRPDRPVRIVVLLDVSGSMQQYSRFFLQFVKGLVGTWAEADAYLFHTRLVRITDTLREADPIRAMTKLALMAQGFGGGTRIGESLRLFNDRYAKAALNSRTVVIILSDGYDTGSPELLAEQLKRLKRKARRVVWLNPLLGWRDYEPVSQAMAAALPHLDCFAAAHSLEALAALEGEFARL
jgi:uncharacterized protein with von Willebrand factor type A (vWA) domain